jgi:hypothetical protein
MGVEKIAGPSGIHNFLKELKSLGLSLIKEEDKLVLRGDAELSAEDIASVRQNQEILGYIKNNKQELLDFLLLSEGKEAALSIEHMSSIYRLSGLQEGMLFHNLYDEKVHAYMKQFACELPCVVPEILAESFRHLLRRHSILRSGFYYETLRIPVQCVWREVSLPIEALDYRHLDEGGQQAAIAAYEEADLRKEFDFSRAPLMRVGLLRLSDDLYRMVWTSHHILMDGWSVAILLEELQSVYELLLSGKKAPEEEEDLYEDYIRYIEGKDKGEEEGWWRSYLSGIDAPVLLPYIDQVADRTKGLGVYKQEEVELDEGFTERLRRCALREQVTLNTLMQGVWSYILYR